jgi:HAD superfamily hydrolase (TIGR01459 family)
MTETITHLSAIADRYDGVLCDIWGVIHNGRAVLPGAAEALIAYRQQGGRVVLVSNVPKPRDPIPGQLDRLGFPRAAWDAIVTSGDAIRAELRKRAPGPMYAIGDEGDDVLWSGLGLMRAGLNTAAFLAVAGLENPFAADAVEAYEDTLQEARARGLDMLCANPDLVVRVGERLMACAGALAREYEKMGGRVIMAGKPHAPIYELAYGELALLGVTERARMLAIGDGVVTDVKGANAQGLDCLFIAAGIHGHELKTQGVLDGAKVQAALAEEHTHARYVMAGLA